MLCVRVGVAVRCHIPCRPQAMVLGNRLRVRRRRAVALLPIREYALRSLRLPESLRRRWSPYAIDSHAVDEIPNWHRDRRSIDRPARVSNRSGSTVFSGAGVVGRRVRSCEKTSGNLLFWLVCEACFHGARRQAEKIPSVATAFVATQISIAASRPPTLDYETPPTTNTTQHRRWHTCQGDLDVPGPQKTGVQPSARIDILPSTAARHPWQSPFQSDDLKRTCTMKRAVVIWQFELRTILGSQTPATDDKRVGQRSKLGRSLALPTTRRSGVVHRFVRSTHSASCSRAAPESIASAASAAHSAGVCNLPAVHSAA